MTTFSYRRDMYATSSHVGVQADIEDAVEEERNRRANVKDVMPGYMAGSKAWDMFHRARFMFHLIAS